jgi:hypothetical protein
MGSGSSSTYKSELDALDIETANYNELKEEIIKVRRMIRDYSDTASAHEEKGKGREVISVSPSPSSSARRFNQEAWELIEKGHSELVPAYVYAKKLESQFVNSQLANKGGKATNYDLGCGGTAKDTKAEADFNKMMRGDDNSDDLQAPHVLLCPCMHSEATNDEDIQPHALHGEKCIGSWMKVNAAAVFYIHLITNEVSYSKPENYTDPDEELKKLSQADGCLHAPLKDLLTVIDKIILQHKKTPLLIDTSSEERVSTFFAYKGRTIDAKGMVSGALLTGMTTIDAMESARKVLVGALKSGSMLAVDIKDSVPNFIGRYSSKKELPIEMFQQGGQVLATKLNLYSKIYREEDREQSRCVVKEGFRLVVITSTPLDKIHILNDQLPMEFLTPVVIV